MEPLKFGSIIALGVIAIAVLFYLSIRSTNEIKELHRLLARLRRELDALKRDRDAKPAGSHAAEAASVQEQPPLVTDIAEELTPPSGVAVPPLETVAPSGQLSDRQSVLERQFGGRAFVWIGGVALALAGFYLVKYSIETGLLTETVRVVLGVCFGLALLAGSQFVRANRRIADGTRIAQALAGAGIADLYGSLFAGTTLYHLLPSWLGFAAMAAVTASALVLSLRHGSPIAVLGLIGGYATPVMIQGEPNAPALFAYLYVVFAGIATLARSRQWAWLPVPAVSIAFLWVVAWLFIGHGPNDAVWLSLFLLGIGATAVASQNQAPSADLTSPQFWLRSLAPAGSIVLMGAVAYHAQFGNFEWGMFALLSICALLLAWFDNRNFRFVPWLAMVANLVMLLGWQAAEPAHFAIILTGFALLFGVGPQLAMRRADYPELWAGQSAASSLCYFLVAYAKLNNPLSDAVSSGYAEIIWAAIAVGAAALFATAVTQLYVLNREVRVRHMLQTIYAVAATTLLSIGLTIVLRQAYLPFAAASQIFVLSWIGTRVHIPALRHIAEVLSVLFAILLLPELVSILGNIWSLGADHVGWTVPCAVPFRLASRTACWRKLPLSRGT